jgi:hypothetical protein
MLTELRERLGTLELWKDSEGKLVAVYREGGPDGVVQDMMSIAPTACTQRESAIERLFRYLVRNNPRLKGA